MFGRTLRSNLAIDNGRSAEFIRRKSYPDKSRCYECGEDGHLSYKCPKNALGERDPPPKKDKRRKKENSKAEKNQVCSFLHLSRTFEFWMYKTSFPDISITACNLGTTNPCACPCCPIEYTCCAATSTTSLSSSRATEEFPAKSSQDFL